MEGFLKASIQASLHRPVNPKASIEILEAEVVHQSGLSPPTEWIAMRRSG